MQPMLKYLFIFKDNCVTFEMSVAYNSEVGYALRRLASTGWIKNSTFSIRDLPMKLQNDDATRIGKKCSIPD